jgi:hypothetical protein
VKKRGGLGEYAHLFMSISSGWWNGKNKGVFVYFYQFQKNSKKN